ncbi:hypothetical protein DFJ73DRAFT_761146 [Zopfochytrium polystomum]|nr:hypothetical protein DFJ73DRAFT_761146 [Zopfochytrium polystomum]
MPPPPPPPPAGYPPPPVKPTPRDFEAARAAPTTTITTTTTPPSSAPAAASPPPPPPLVVRFDSSCLGSALRLSQAAKLVQKALATHPSVVIVTESIRFPHERSTVDRILSACPHADPTKRRRLSLAAHDHDPTPHRASPGTASQSVPSAAAAAGAVPSLRSSRLHQACQSNTLLTVLERDHLQLVRRAIRHAYIGDAVERNILARVQRIREFAAALSVIKEMSPRSTDSLVAEGCAMAAAVLAGQLEAMVIPSVSLFFFHFNFQYRPLLWANTLVIFSKRIGIDSVTLQADDIAAGCKEERSNGVYVDEAFYDHVAEQLEVLIRNSAFGPFPSETSMNDALGPTASTVLAALLTIALRPRVDVSEPSRSPIELLLVSAHISALYTADPRLLVSDPQPQSQAGFVGATRIRSSTTARRLDRLCADAAMAIAGGVPSGRPVSPLALALMVAHGKRLYVTRESRTQSWDSNSGDDGKAGPRAAWALMRVCSLDSEESGNHGTVIVADSGVSALEPKGGDGTGKPLKGSSRVRLAPVAVVSRRGVGIIQADELLGGHDGTNAEDGGMERRRSGDVSASGWASAAAGSGGCGKTAYVSLGSALLQSLDRAAGIRPLLSVSSIRSISVVVEETANASSRVGSAGGANGDEETKSAHLGKGRILGQQDMVETEQLNEEEEEGVAIDDGGSLVDADGVSCGGRGKREAGSRGSAAAAAEATTAGKTAARRRSRLEAAMVRWRRSEGFPTAHRPVRVTVQPDTALLTAVWEVVQPLPPGSAGELGPNDSSLWSSSQSSSSQSSPSHPLAGGGGGESDFLPSSSRQSVEVQCTMEVARVLRVFADGLLREAEAGDGGGGSSSSSNSASGSVPGVPVLLSTRSRSGCVFSLRVVVPVQHMEACSRAMHEALFSSGR